MELGVEACRPGLSGQSSWLIHGESNVPYPSYLEWSLGHTLIHRFQVAVSILKRDNTRPGQGSELSNVFVFGASNQEGTNAKIQVSTLELTG